MLSNAHKSKAILLLMTLAAAGISMTCPASAQTSPPEKSVAPTPPPSGQNNGAADNRQDLSKKLDRCNGELKAPPVGDGKMVEPAPETGNSRVIRPGDLPPNANPSNNSGG